MYHTVDRLANIFMNTSDVDKVWNIVKQVKAQRSNDEILTKVRAVEKKLKIKKSEYVFENMSRKHLKTASEMFLYLDGKMEPVTKMWLEFFGNLFETESANHIILALNRLMRKTATGSNSNFFIVIEKLFRKATILLKLKNQEIQNMLPGKFKNISSMGSKSFIVKGMNKHKQVMKYTTVKCDCKFRFSHYQSPSSYYHERQQNISICLHTFL